MRPSTSAALVISPTSLPPTVSFEPAREVSRCEESVARHTGDREADIFVVSSAVVSSAPGDVFELHRCDVEAGEAGALEGLACIWSLHADRSELVGDVGDLDVVHDDVLVEDLL